MNGQIKKILALIALTLTLSVIFIIWPILALFIIPMKSTINNQPLVLAQHTSAYQFALDLEQRKLIQSKEPLLKYLRLTGLAQQLKAGVYGIKNSETVTGLINRIVAGDILKFKFAIIAGSTQDKITQDLQKASYLNYRSKDWYLIQNNHTNSEGLLLADTYQYPGGAESKVILEKASKALQSYLDKIWLERDQEVPYNSAYELLIAASIIEKETAIPSERQLISGVIVNRLRLKMPLQMDPTTIYGLGLSYKGKLTHQDMQIDSPYNSYKHRGLPPTPIAMVGKEALDAAAHPQKSNFLYYVSKGNGAHQFSQTYEQQKNAIKQFQHKGNL